MEIRKKHPKLGKEKIKVLLDKLCKQHNIPTISVSSIRNIIKMLKEERKLNHESMPGKELQLMEQPKANSERN